MIRLHFLPTVGTLFHPDPLTRCQVEGDIKRVGGAKLLLRSNWHHRTFRSTRSRMSLGGAPTLAAVATLPFWNNIQRSSFSFFGSFSILDCLSFYSCLNFFSRLSFTSILSFFRFSLFRPFRKVTKSRFSCPFCSSPVSPPLPAGAGPLPGALMAPAGIVRVYRLGWKVRRRRSHPSQHLVSLTTGHFHFSE